MAEGLSLIADNTLIRLKWHRLRRHASDAEFDPSNLALGLDLGASMEIDLQARGDDGFAVLHDADLSGETTGQGPVARTTLEDLGRLKLLRADRAPLSSEGLSGLLTRAHPAALLQLDMKNDRAEVSEAHIRHLASHFGAFAGQLIVSGASERLIADLAGAVPGLGVGYDPTDAMLEAARAGGIAAMEARLLRSLRHQCRPDMVYLNWEMLLAAAAAGLDLVALAHAEGVAVDAWTHAMQDPEKGFTDSEWERFSALVALKPDQITTDSPVATEAACLSRIS